MNEFKIGDTVEAYGCEGTVTAYYHDMVEVVMNSNSQTLYFYFDGKVAIWHKEPSLKLISRPKKKVTKTYTGYLVINKENGVGKIYTTEDAAKVFSDNGDIIVKITKDYEGEE